MGRVREVAPRAPHQIRLQKEQGRRRVTEDHHPRNREYVMNSADSREMIEKIVELIAETRVMSGNNASPRPEMEQKKDVIVV